MTDLDQNMQTILETLKQKAVNTNSIAELERLVLKASQDFARTALETLASTQPASNSPMVPCPTCQKRGKAREVRFVQVHSLWGIVQLPKARYKCQSCKTQYTTFQDPNLDESGCTPLVLERAEYLSLLLPHQITTRVLHEWGVNVSSSLLSKLSQQLEQTLTETRLHELSRQPLLKSLMPSRVWMIEIDGMFVLTHVPSESSTDAESGAVWREVKTAVLFLIPRRTLRAGSLQERHTFGPLPDQYLARCARLRTTGSRVTSFRGFQHARHADWPCGWSIWIADLFADLGVHRHVLDVFHASQYLETIMVALAWSDDQRLEHRRDWLRGEVDGLAWLNWHVKPDQSARFDEVAQKALAYLNRQAFLGRLAYPAFKREGFEVIGSGQIEGANKSVLAARLRVSGAIWSEVGADAKAFARGLWASRRRVVEFDQVRLSAFPRAA